jgi:hypothetical protein
VREDCENGGSVVAQGLIRARGSDVSISRTNEGISNSYKISAIKCHEASREMWI